MSWKWTPVVARLSAVVDDDVKAFTLKFEAGKEDSPEERQAALSAMLESLIPYVPRDLRRDAGRVRAARGPRPRALVAVECLYHEDGTSTGELRRLFAPTDDVGPEEGEQLVDRAQTVLAARIIEELTGR